MPRNVGMSVIRVKKNFDFFNWKTTCGQLSKLQPKYQGYTLLCHCKNLNKQKRQATQLTIFAELHRPKDKFNG